MSSEGKFAAGILVGAALGAVVGLLWAPRSGRETRGMIKEEVSNRYYDSLETVQDNLDKTRAQVIDKLDQKSKEIKEAVQNLTKELGETGRKAISNISASISDKTDRSEAG
jgi:gas vesicle protein